MHRLPSQRGGAVSTSFDTQEFLCGLTGVYCAPTHALELLKTEG